MPIMFRNGKILFRAAHGGKIAFSKDCCCDAPCCCGWTVETAPAELNITITQKTGNCDELPDTTKIYFLGMEGDFLAWAARDFTEMHEVPGGIGYFPHFCYFKLYCDTDEAECRWFLEEVASCNGESVLVSAKCSPFEVVFDVEGFGDCDGTYRLTITL